MRRLFFWLHHMLLIPVLFILVLVSLLRVGLHSHPVYHHQVEIWLQQVLEQPVAINDFTLLLQGSDLVIDVAGAKLGSNNLELERLSFSLDLHALLLDQQLAMSAVQLFGLTVTLQEQADGSWQPSGLEPIQKDPDTPTSRALLALLEQTGSLVLVDAQITLVPQLGAAININNVAARLSPLAEEGVVVNLHASYPQTDGKLAVLAHLYFAENMAINTAQAHVQIQELPLQPLWQQLQVTEWQAGQLSANIWLQVEEQNMQQVAIRDLNLNTTYQGLAVDWRSNLDMVHQADQWRLQVADIGGAINDQVWPIEELAVFADTQQLHLSSPSMQLQPIGDILRSLPGLPAKVTTPIIALSPPGQALQPRLTWYKANPKDFLFTASMDSASVSAWKSVPEVSGADGLITINAKGGKVSIDDVDGIQVHMPKLSTGPWQFDSLAGEVAWAYDARYSHLFSSVIHLTQDDAQFKLQMAGDFPRLGIKEEASLQLRLGLQNVDVNLIPTMLPDVILGNKLGDYLSNAAQAGQIHQGGITFNGLVGQSAKDLGPYSRSTGVWGSAQLPKVRYASGWPEVYKAQFDFSTSQQTIVMQIQQGQLMGSGATGFDMSGWQVSVPILNFDNKNQAMIAVAGSLEGDGKLFQQLEQKLPSAVVIPGWIKDLDPRGNLHMSGVVKVPYGPLAKGRKPEYDINVTGQQVAGDWQQKQIALRQVAMATHVTEQGLQSLMADGLADGHPFRLRLVETPQLDTWLGDLPEMTWQNYAVESYQQDWLRLQGKVPRDYVQHKLGLSDLTLDQWLPTQAEIDVQLPICFLQQATCQLALGQLHFSPQDVHWPDMMGPTGEISWIWQHQGDQQKLYANSGEQHLALAIEKAQLSGVGIGLGEAAPPVTQGTYIKGSTVSVDVPYWLAYTQATSGSENSLQLPPLKAIEVQSQSLSWHELQLQNTFLTYDVVEDGWAIGLVAEEATGHIFYAGDDSPWLVDIDHLRIQLPEEELAEGEEKKDLLATVDPSMFPNMDIELHDFVKNDQSYGHWKLKARNADGKLYLHDIEAQMHSSELAANMIWSKHGDDHKTEFSGRVQSYQVADTLTGWGYSPTIDSDNGALEAQFSWPASPLAFDIKHASGDFGLRVKKGQFAESPGVTGSLKVLSLLDVGRLVQHIKLDFSDIFSDAYQFDNIGAHYSIVDGVARTVVPASFNSSSLELSLDGYIDFKNRTVDNDLFVTIPVTDKLSFAALLVGLPQLSGVLYVVDKLVGGELSTFTSARYGVTGNLDKPDVALRKMFDANNQPKSLDERVNNVFKLQ
ncbi:MAG: hypothetical protein GY905_16005 [Gammaproteobacteria bacterium]|nr:hypothetical protein [Gammaproteobacteria bacterium]